MDTLKKLFGSRLRNPRLFSKTYARLWLSTVGRTIPFSDSCASPHETVDRNGIPIDRGIVQFVEALWNAGINTSNSCQGDPDLDEVAHRVAPNFYDGCYAATVTLDTVDDAYTVLSAIDKAMYACGFWEENRRANVSFGMHHGVFVTFPAKFLKRPDFCGYFESALGI